MAAKALLTFMAAALLAGGFLYICRPEKIMQFHRALRDVLLNDAYISLRRRRIGSLMLLAGMVVLAIAWLEK